MRRPLLLGLAAASALAAALPGIQVPDDSGRAWAGAPNPRRKAPVLPDWSIVSDNDVRLSPGFASLEGSYEFTVGERSGSLQLAYGPNGDLAGTAFIGTSFLQVSASYEVDDEGVQQVWIADFPAGPGFEIRGAVSADARRIVGTYSHAGPYLDFTEPGSGSVTVYRLTPLFIPDTFRCIFSMSMNRKGAVTGQRDDKGRERRATFELYRNVRVEGGLVRGKVKTDTVLGTTTANVTIKGKVGRRPWKVTLAGPVDEAGFHALADFDVEGWKLTGIPFELPSQPGPEPPPPPPPPPPRNQLGQATAVVVGSQVTIERANVPVKFGWGRGSDATAQFPLTILDESDDALVADPTTSGGAAPVRFFVQIGNVVYGTASPGGSVTLTIRRDPGGNRLFSTTRGQQMQILCQGTIAAVSGKRKKVDALLVATVQ